MAMMVLRSMSVVLVGADGAVGGLVGCRPGDYALRLFIGAGGWYCIAVLLTGRIALWSMSAVLMIRPDCVETEPVSTKGEKTSGSKKCQYEMASAL
jgi:hypothetical protein